uniref:Uncharacterized protein LOC111103791 n=1 Tax=Crassostrea virginica TaxID=6565 RepID=A0A8B8AP58_CRAVI|nr:uncharacterized protein LOC111103791 [Crassostrea virginica]
MEHSKTESPSLGKSINRSRPMTKRPTEWTEHTSGPEISTESTKNEKAGKTNFWQKVKNLVKAPSNGEQDIKDKPVHSVESKSDPTKDWEELLRDRKNESSNVQPKPMTNVGTPIRKTREENSIPQSQSQWQRAFQTISEMKRTDANQPKPMDVRQLARSYEPVNQSSAAASDEGRPKPAAGAIESRGSRPQTGGSQMDFWGAEDFSFDPSPTGRESQNTKESDVWTMSS